MSVAIPRPAATVVVVRPAPAPAGFDVLMVRRSDQVAFMGGAYVFPGGRVDEADSAVSQRWTDSPGEAAASSPGEGPASPRSRFADLTFEQEMVFRTAAARELSEEAGVRVGIDGMVPFAHWITPESETRRYDTRFFIVEMPPDQQATHDAGETTEIVWVTPADAIARCLNDTLLLPPPTWTTLRRLARFTTVPEALAWARATPIVTIQPQLVRDDEQAILTLPGDPAFPAIDGWDVPAETRFHLQDGRWRPART